MNPNRVFVIAVNVFREVIRDRALYIILLFALLLVAAAILLPEVSAGTDGKILLDLGLAAIEILGLVVAIFVGTGLVNKEIEKRTVLVLMAKPISRAEFIFGKHLGLSTVLAVLVAAMTLINLLVLNFRQVSYSLAPLLLASLYQIFGLSLVAAAAILFGVFTSSLLAALLTFAMYLMGNLTRDLISFGRLSENPQLQQLMQGLYLLLPDLSRLDLKNQAVYGLQVLPGAIELISSAVYALIYMILLLTLASTVFAKRQF
ncbi:ABC transporter permease [Microcoleus sp. FACHB-1515]|uniref:ABC transporter permease subunit n=1 Tax=Cyanophyceae TaxID=3028117 RepID=UPI0016886BFE|nr:ABC transporter permease subunit [Microcoleus sp. FACHB-1515]MBD2089883.1 ABC transporter permease [Microcoleus sp. FACHB-1515]